MYNFTSPPAGFESSSCFTSLLTLGIVSTFLFSHYGGWVVVSHCAFPWWLRMLSTFLMPTGHMGDLSCELGLFSWVVLAEFREGGQGVRWRTVEGPGEHGHTLQTSNGLTWEEGTKMVCGCQRSEDIDLLRWPGHGFPISAMNCLKINNVQGGTGLIQEVVSTCYARHVSRDARALDEVFQRRLTSRLMVGFRSWQDEISGLWRPGSVM